MAGPFPMYDVNRQNGIKNRGKKSRWSDFLFFSKGRIPPGPRFFLQSGDLERFSIDGDG